jgi:hypothetical protein
VLADGDVQVVLLLILDPGVGPRLRPKVLWVLRSPGQLERDEVVLLKFGWVAVGVSELDKLGALQVVDPLVVEPGGVADVVGVDAAIPEAVDVDVDEAVPELDVEQEAARAATRASVRRRKCTCSGYGRRDGEEGP